MNIGEESEQIEVPVPLMPGQPAPVEPTPVEAPVVEPAPPVPVQPALHADDEPWAWPESHGFLPNGEVF